VLGRAASCMLFLVGSHVQHIAFTALCLMLHPISLLTVEWYKVICEVHAMKGMLRAIHVPHPSRCVQRKQQLFTGCWQVLIFPDVLFTNIRATVHLR